MKNEYHLLSVFITYMYILSSYISTCSLPHDDRVLLKYVYIDCVVLFNLITNMSNSKKVNYNFNIIQYKPLRNLKMTMLSFEITK